MASSMVLNVNDDEARRYVAGRMLKQGGFAVLDAASGAETLRLAAAERPDLVLLDVKLPDLDGFEVCRRLKSSPVTAGITVVMLSAVLTEAASQVEGLEAGADGYLTEPLDPAVMVATLRALLRARRSEAAVRESREVFGRVIDGAAALITAVDGDGRIVLFNPACEALSGYRRHEVLGRPLLETFVPERFRGEAGGRFVSPLTETLAAPHVHPWRTKSAEERLVEWRCFRVPGLDGEPLTVGIGHDVTAERQAAARRATQFAVTAVLAESPTVDVAIPSLLHTICEGMAWPAGELWRVEPDGLRLAASCRRPAAPAAPNGNGTAGVVIVKGAGLCGRVWRTGRAAWTTDVTRDIEPASLAAAARGIRAAIAFPVANGAEVTGVMVFLSAEVNSPDADLVRMMTDLGAQIGQFVERRRAEEALRLSEARYRLVARATRHAIRDWDLATGHLAWNDAVEDLFGHRPEEVRRVSDWEALVHPDDRSRVVAGLGDAIAQGREVWSDEYRFRTASGWDAVVSDRGFIERSGGRPLRVIAAMEDVTERRAREDRDRLRALSLGILKAREEEARRIARELHDEAGQLLASVHLALGRLSRDLGGADRARLDEVVALLERTESHLRTLAHDLRPTVLDDLGLAPALDLLARRVSARSGVRVTLETTLEDRLPPLVETALYRIVQEALTNVTRHAGATSATVQLHVGRPVGNRSILPRALGPSTPVPSARSVRCTVRDDGAGFCPAWAARDGGGLGLIGIRERVEALHGRLSLDSAPGRGTELSVELPLEDEGDASPAR
jgi:PAS domain S-box-containing protein